MTPWLRHVAFTALLAVAGQQQLQRAAASPGDGASALPTHLAETGLFGTPRIDAVAAATRLFAPQYPLWTDGAAKRRWVYLPAGTVIDGRNPRRWEFPAGTRFWKEFSFAGRRVETRFLWKTADRGWLAGSYVWNDRGTDARLAPEEGIAGALDLAPGKTHNIPSRMDCSACHGEDRAPLGFNPLQLSDDRDPNALHAEPLGSGMVTLNALLNEGRLAGADAALRQMPPRIRTSDPQARAVAGYLAANCGGCHNGNSAISAQVPSLAYADVMADGDAALKRLVGHPTRWQAPGKAEGTVLLDPAAPQSSALLLRMRSRRPSSQMPPLGTVMQDQQAIDAISGWLARFGGAS